MRVIFAPNGNLQIDDARIIWKNFSGAPTRYNREGDRNFALVIPHQVYEYAMDEYGNILVDENGEPIVAQMLVDELIDQGWNVTIKAPRTPEEDPFMYMRVKVKFNHRGPNVYLKTGRNVMKLDEETIGCLDFAEIIRLDLDIRPYNWERNGDTGRSAYLQGMDVEQQIVDRFAARYAEEEYPEE